MNKDSRLSFRISPKLSSRIDMVIRKSEGGIKDRSEFGMQAIQYFLNHLLSSDNDIEMLGKSILVLAEKQNLDSLEIQAVRNFVYDDILAPIENHPKFEELMLLREKLPRDKKNQLSERLFTAKYGEINKIYSEYIQ